MGSDPNYQLPMASINIVPLINQALIGRADNLIRCHKFLDSMGTPAYYSCNRK